MDRVMGRVMGRVIKPVFPQAVGYGDILKGLPVRHMAAVLVYCSRLLGHFALQDLRQARRNTRLWKRSVFICRTVRPSLRALTEAYVGDLSPESARRFMRDT